jgi:hypothetical protein
MKMALRLALQRRLNIPKLTLGKEVTLAALLHGCAISVCCVISLLIEGSEPAKLQLYPQPAAHTNNRTQYNLLFRFKKLLNLANK